MIAASAETDGKTYIYIWSGNINGVLNIAVDDERKKKSSMHMCSLLLLLRDLCPSFKFLRFLIEL